MIGYEQSDVRILYPSKEGWAIGSPDFPVTITSKFKACLDIYSAMQSPGQCVVRSLVSVENSDYVPVFLGDEAYDDAARRAFRDIDASIKIARKEGHFDLVSTYEKQRDEIREFTKGDLITPYRSKRLDDGDPIKPLTHSIRQRKLRLLDYLDKKGLADEAADLYTSYVVANRSVIFYSERSHFQWSISPAA